MKRREIIKYTAWATGATLSAPLVSSILVGCKSEPTSAATGQFEFFDEKGFDIVSKLVDIILPRTDSPSGTDVGVHHMIDHMVASIYTAAQQEEYNNSFQNMAVHLSSLDLWSQSEEDQAGIVSEVLNYSNPGLKEVKNGLTNIRQQSIAYYLNTEEIATKFLNYLPVPGGWEPCTPVSELGGKAWAI